MNYANHYEKLCQRGKYRELDSYTEKHHVLPRCLGGTDDPDNIVNLTPEEHYVAHQLLIKMHPTHTGLIWAAIQMTRHSKNENRSNNKIYGWLRRKYQHVAKQRTGKKNGSYGKSWYYHPKTLHNIKCLPQDVPNEYIKGRRLKRKLKTSNCTICGKDTGKKQRKYCDSHLREFRTEFYEQGLHKQSGRANDTTGNRKSSDEEIEAILIKNDLNIDDTMRELGYKIPQHGYSKNRFKKIRDRITHVSPQSSKLEKA